MPQFEKHLKILAEVLQPFGITFSVKSQVITFRHHDKRFHFEIAEPDYNFSAHHSYPILPLDYLVRAPSKLAASLSSKMGLNKKIFARNCEVVKVEKPKAETFLNTYHLMNATQSGSNYGLSFKGELLAMASFSKGRKMRRLAEDQRSFELIRFCCKPGFTVTGGLSKLVKQFAKEKKAGDVMTYVDQQWSDGSSFVKAGFKPAGETAPVYFLIHKKNYERKMMLSSKSSFDPQEYYLTQNAGNLKLIFTPHV